MQVYKLSCFLPEAAPVLAIMLFAEVHVIRRLLMQKLLIRVHESFLFLPMSYKASFY